MVKSSYIIILSGQYGDLVNMVIWTIWSYGQYGHLVNIVIWSIRSSGHLIIWSSLFLVITSFAHLVIRTSGYLVIWSICLSGHLVVWFSSHRVIGSSGHLVLWSFIILWKTLLFLWNTWKLCAHSESCFGDLIEQSGYLVGLFCSNQSNKQFTVLGCLWGRASSRHSPLTTSDGNAI